MTNITDVNKGHLKCKIVDGSFFDGKRESIFFSFSLDARPRYKIFEEPSSILFKTVNKDKIEDIMFYLEDDDGKEVDFNSESLTSTVMLMKIEFHTL